MGIQGKSLHIMTPMHDGKATRTYIESFTKLCLLLNQYGVKFSWCNNCNESLISRARNRHADIYLKNQDETHAVFIDSDIGFNPLDILAMLEHDFDICGASCVKKGFRWDRVQEAIKKNGRTFTTDEMERIAGDYIFNWLPGTVGMQTFNLGTPLEVHNIGTGLMMIRRNVFEGYKEAYPDRWYDSRGADKADLPGPVVDFFRVGINPDTRQYDSEDYWFCIDCRAIGFKVWMLPWVNTSHTGVYTWKGDMTAVAQMVGHL